MDAKSILPQTVTNEYHGNKMAKHVFYAIVALTIVRSLIHIIAPDGGAQSIATIPLDSYSDVGRATVVYMFGVWGLSQLIMGIFYLIVAIRYSCLIPLMYLFLVFEYLTRIAIGHMKPVTLAGTAPGAVGNLPFAVISALMFFLSIMPSGNGKPGRS